MHLKNSRSADQLIDSVGSLLNLFFCPHLGNIKFISPALWKMTHLTSLYLNDNSIARLPPDISKLSCLTHLDISSNKLRSLPQEVGDLLRLRELLANNNYLRVLPYELGKLYKLQHLGRCLTEHLLSMQSCKLAFCLVC